MTQRLTYAEADDVMRGIFLAAWNAAAPSIVGSIPEIRWQGVEGPSVPPPVGYWVFFGTHEMASEVSSISCGIAPDEYKRYTSEGFLAAKIYCPLADATAWAKGRELAMAVRDAFRSANTGNAIWFRNARVTPMPSSQNAHRFDVLADYQYDT